MFRSILLLCVAVLALPANAVAQSIPLTIERIWTRDGEGTDKPSFTPDDGIQYTTSIKNSSSQPVTMTITFSAAGPIREPGSSREIYFYQQGNVTVQPGLNGYYSPSTIPRDAEGGIHELGIGIKVNQPR